MPTVQYLFNGDLTTKSMVTPKQITKLTHWYKEARKAIQQIPDALLDVFADNEWMIFHAEADPKWVKFDLKHRNGQRAYIVILRK